MSWSRKAVAGDDAGVRGLRFGWSIISTEGSRLWSSTLRLFYSQIMKLNCSGIFISVENAQDEGTITTRPFFILLSSLQKYLQMIKVFYIITTQLQSINYSS